MKLEAVIVCKDYADFLSYTLPENIPYFDHVVVVTHPDDKATQAVCSKYSIDCVKTTAMHEEGAKFNKGRAINLGLGHLKGLDWILHLDADIVLPHRFKDMLNRGRLNTENLYGADRVNVVGYENWMKLKTKLVPHYSSHYFVEPPKGEHMGARIIHSEHGYCPIGYFQLWNKNAHKRYPINQGTAEHTDVLFSAQWDRKNRILLPEVIVYHLESEACKMGANWNGRTTKPFGPCQKHHPKQGYHPCKCHN